MVTTKEIAWLAGIIEGEGCISLHPARGPRFPTLHVTMADRDVIEPVTTLLRLATGRTYSREVGEPIKIDRRRRKPTHRDLYTTRIYGNRVVQWLMTIYPLLGVRRRTKAAEVIRTWYRAPYMPHTARCVVGPIAIHFASTNLLISAQSATNASCGRDGRQEAHDKRALGT